MPPGQPAAAAKRTSTAASIWTSLPHGPSREVVVVRLPGEDLNRLRILANSRNQALSALLRDVLIAYCQQL